MHNYRAKCQAVSLIYWWIHRINVLQQFQDFELWISGKVIFCFVDVYFGVHLAYAFVCRWILPLQFGRVFQREAIKTWMLTLVFQRGLWGTLLAVTSGTTLRRGGAIPPSGLMTIPWYWQELLFTTSKNPKRQLSSFCMKQSGSGEWKTFFRGGEKMER